MKQLLRHNIKIELPYWKCNRKDEEGKIKKKKRKAKNGGYIFFKGIIEKDLYDRM